MQSNSRAGCRELMAAAGQTGRPGCRELMAAAGQTGRPGASRDTLIDQACFAAAALDPVVWSTVLARSQQCDRPSTVDKYARGGGMYGRQVLRCGPQ